MKTATTIVMTFLIMTVIIFFGDPVMGQQIADRKLIVGTKEAAPFSMKTKDGAWTGISIELWRDIATALNLTFEFRELTLKQLIDDVADGSIDAAVAALTITPEREKILDFTHSFYSTGLGIAVSSEKRSPWMAVIGRFASLAFLKVIAALVLILLIVGLLVWWFEHKKNPDQFGGNAAKGIGSGFWWSAVTMTTVGYGDKAPLTFGGRFMALIWMFVAIIIISSFTAAITSSLTVSQLESPVKGPEDLPKVRVGTISDTTSEAFLKEEQISYLPYSSPQEGLGALYRKQIDAFIYDAPLLQYLIQQEYKPTIRILPNRLLQQNYAIALPVGSPLRESINVMLLQKIREKAWKDSLFKYLG